MGNGRSFTAHGQRITENGRLDIYSSQDQLVRPNQHRFTFEDCRRVVSQRVTGNGSRIAIKFLTPTHLKADGKIVARPNFHHLIKRLRDRINALAHFYCGETLDVDFKSFGERAEAVQTIRCHVRWEDRDRRSWKTGISLHRRGDV